LKKSKAPYFGPKIHFSVHFRLIGVVYFAEGQGVVSLSVYYGNLRLLP